jgi:hypothetical protein
MQWFRLVQFTMMHVNEQSGNDSCETNLQEQCSNQSVVPPLYSHKRKQPDALPCIQFHFSPSLNTTMRFGGFSDHTYIWTCFARAQCARNDGKAASGAHAHHPGLRALQARSVILQRDWGCGGAEETHSVVGCTYACAACGCCGRAALACAAGSGAAGSPGAHACASCTGTCASAR